MVSKNEFYQNIPQVILNNFINDRYFVKINSSCSKWRLSGQISKIEQNDVTNDVIDQKRDMQSKKSFAKIFLCLC